MPDIIVPLEILPIDGKPEHRMFALAVSTRAADDAGEKPVITVTGTDGSEDRHGSVISPDGWDIASFARNPVVTWSHQDDTLPAIGRAPNPRRVGGAWDFDIEFAVEQWKDYGGGNLAQLVYRLMKDDYLRAVSVAFIPKKWEDRAATTIPSFFAEDLRYIQQELTAISPCNIGSNRNGLKKAVGDRVISENEATILGLGTMLRVEMPVIVRGNEPAPVPVVEPRAAEPTAAKNASGAAKFRAALKSSLAALNRCYDCYPDPYYTSPWCPLCYQSTETHDCDEQLTPEEMAAEQVTITALIASEMNTLGNALAGWQTSEHEAVEDQCSSIVYSCMYTVDRLNDFIEYWYDEAEDSAVNMPDMSVMMAFTEKVTRDVPTVARLTAKLASRKVGSNDEPIDTTETRVGAEFSGKNKKAITDMHGHASEIMRSCETLITDLADATTSEKSVDPSANVFRVIGPDSSDREEEAGQLMISVTDTPDAGAGGRSKGSGSASLYDSEALPVKHARA